MKSEDSALQFAGLLDRMPLGVYVIDADFRIVHVNPLALPAFGAVPGGLVGRDFGEVLHIMREGYYADEIIGIFRHTLETGDAYAKTESSSLRGRPSGAFYEWRVERIPMNDGRFGLVCFFRDISREVHTHRLDSFRLALNETLRALTSPAEIQAAAAKLLGEHLMVSAVMYTEVETRPDSDYYIVHQYYRAAGSGDYSGEYRANDFGQTLYDEMRAGRTLVMNDVPVETRLSAEEKQAHGALGIRAYINVPLIKGGKHVAQVSVHQAEPRFWSTDEVATVEETAERTWAAVERAKAEAKARASQQDSARQRRLYEAILSNTPDFAYIFDPQHRFIYVNEGLLKTLGKSWDEAIGKTCLELGYEPWHAEMHNNEIDRVIATRKPIRNEVPFDGVNGRRMYDYIFVPVFGPNGEVEAVAGTTRDVTEIKEADRRKDEFLATLAHELRNPLAPIRSGIQVLTLSSQDNDSTMKVCQMMERQVDHMVRLVDDLMEISRISRGKIELKPEHTTLESVIRNAVDTSTPLIVAAGHTLHLSMPSGSVPVYGDPIRLSQVIANLLNNASRYTDSGGHIWLSAEQQGGKLFIRVRDNGIGIPADALPVIFDMFVQVKSATSHTHGGLGIGLSLVKHLVEMHGGTVSATSDGPGKGSEFCITLSCIDDRRPATASLLRHEHVESAMKKRILIVDDNEDAASGLAQVVTLLGAEVQVANDGVTALELMHSFQPQIALLDLGMPVMSGFEVAARAREIPGMEKLLMVALTGWGQPEDRERTKAAGFAHHLVKPAELPDLQRVLSL